MYLEICQVFGRWNLYYRLTSDKIQKNQNALKATMNYLPYQHRTKANLKFEYVGCICGGYLWTCWGGFGGCFGGVLGRFLDGILKVV